MDVVKKIFKYLLLPLFLIIGLSATFFSLFTRNRRKGSERVRDNISRTGEAINESRDNLQHIENRINGVKDKSGEFGRELSKSRELSERIGDSNRRIEEGLNESEAKFNRIRELTDRGREIILNLRKGSREEDKEFKDNNINSNNSLSGSCYSSGSSTTGQLEE